MKKGQLDHPVILFSVIVIGLLIIAPVMLKVFYNVNTQVGDQLGNMSVGGEEAKKSVNTILGTAINFWDGIMIFAFLVALILMFVSAFLINVHPFWIVLYIILSFMLILFAPNIIQAIDNIYDSPEFATEVTDLSFLDFIRTYFGELLVGLLIITGIIIYGKISLTGGGGRG